MEYQTQLTDQPVTQISDAPVTTPKSNHSLVIGFLIVAILLVAGSVFAGIQIGKNQQLQQQSVAVAPTEKLIPSTSQPSVSPTAAPAITNSPTTSTTTWKTYENTKLGIEFKYPSYLSESKIWKETAIFIIEDDAQNGPDHVDAHRSTAYLAGGFVKRKLIDHTMYSTSSMLRTMELILGLPPMSQYDAAALPMYKCFSATPDLSPFKAVPPNVDLNEKSVKNTASARLSETFDFSKEDRIPDLVFSEVIWKAVKGEASIMPAPRRSAFVKMVEEDDEK